MNLSGVIAHNLLEIGLVDGDLGSLKRRDVGADPRNEDELGTLGLGITGGHSDESELGLVILEVGEEVIPVSGASLLDDDLLVALIAEDRVGVRVLVVSDIRVSLG